MLLEVQNPVQAQPKVLWGLLKHQAFVINKHVQFPFSFSVIEMVSTSKPTRDNGSSVVECETRKQVNQGSNSTFATVWKIVHFLSLNDAPVHLAVQMNGGNMSD